jgi:hypothetical protein
MKKQLKKLNRGNLEEGSKGDDSAYSMQENVASLFQPDTVLAAQYFDNLHRKAILQSEKRLMLAILEDAIDCYQDNVLAQSGKAKVRFDEVQEWIVERDRDWVFSFESICEELGFDPRYVRQGLLRWKHQQLVQHAEANNPEVRERPRYAAVGGNR